MKSSMSCSKVREPQWWKAALDQIYSLLPNNIEKAATKYVKFEVKPWPFYFSYRLCRLSGFIYHSSTISDTLAFSSWNSCKCIVKLKTAEIMSALAYSTLQSLMIYVDDSLGPVVSILCIMPVMSTGSIIYALRLVFVVLACCALKDPLRP